MRGFGEVHLGEAAPPDPAAGGHVGDRVVLAHQPRQLRQAAIRHPHVAPCLGAEALGRGGDLRREQLREAAGLAARRPEAGGLDQQPFEAAHPRHRAVRQEAPHLPGQADEDRAALDDGDGRPAGPVAIDDHGDLAVRVARQVGGRFLLAGADVHPARCSRPRAAGRGRRAAPRAMAAPAAVRRRPGAPPRFSAARLPGSRRTCSRSGGSSGSPPAAGDRAPACGAGGPPDCPPNGPPPSGDGGTRFGRDPPG